MDNLEPLGAADLEFQIVYGQVGTPSWLLLGANFEISKSAAPRGKFWINQVKLSSNLMRRGVYIVKYSDSKSLVVG